LGCWNNGDGSNVAATQRLVAGIWLKPSPTGLCSEKPMTLLLSALGKLCSTLPEQPNVCVQPRKPRASLALVKPRAAKRRLERVLGPTAPSLNEPPQLAACGCAQVFAQTLVSEHAPAGGDGAGGFDASTGRGRRLRLSRILCCRVVRVLPEPTLPARALCAVGGGETIAPTRPVFTQPSLLRVA
jgi:hypothetical protein